MITNTFRAKQLYTAYCAAVGGVAFNGDPLPSWEAFEADPKKAMQVAGWIAVANVPQNDTRTDDEKVRAILMPYLDEMVTLDKRFLTDITFQVEHRDEDGVKTKINAWLFSTRHEFATLADMMQAFRTWDPAARERERKLARIEQLKTELAELESEGGAK